MAQDRGAGQGVVALLRGTVVGEEIDDGVGMDGGPVGLGQSQDPYDYDEGGSGSGNQDPSSPSQPPTSKGLTKLDSASTSTPSRRIKANKPLMPSCVTVSFSVKGWLASGVKVESLNIDMKRSKGLGAGVQPYKGVKYVCVSRRGVEGRC
jgi:hypothetical protein